MDNRGEVKKKLLSAFDITVITVVVLIAVLFLGWKAINRSSGVSESTGIVRYTIELTNMVGNSAYAISEGDELRETVKNTVAGTVKSVEISNTLRWSDDLEEGGRSVTETDLKTALIVVEVPCVISDSTISAKNGGIEIRVGKEIGVAGPGYRGKGNIVAIERG